MVVRKLLFLLAFTFFCGCGEDWLSLPDGRDVVAAPRYRWKLVDGAPGTLWTRDGETIWLGGRGSLLYHSTDGGESWTTHDTGLRSPGGGPSSIDALAAVPDGETIWASGRDGALVRGTRRDEGQGYDWEPLAAPEESGRIEKLVAAPDSVRLWALSERRLYRSLNGGDHWERLATSVVDFDVGFEEGDRSHLWVLNRPEEEPLWNLGYSFEDRGLTWDEIAPRLKGAFPEGTIRAEGASARVFLWGSKEQLDLVFPVTAQGRGESGMVLSYPTNRPHLGGEVRLVASTGSDIWLGVPTLGLVKRFPAEGPGIGRLSIGRGLSPEVRFIAPVEESAEILALDADGTLFRCASDCTALRRSAGSLTAFLPPLRNGSSGQGTTTVGKGQLYGSTASGDLLTLAESEWVPTEVGGGRARALLASPDGQWQFLLLESRTLLIRSATAPEWSALPSLPGIQASDDSYKAEYQLLGAGEGELLLMERVPNALPSLYLWYHQREVGWRQLETPERLSRRELWSGALPAGGEPTLYGIGADSVAGWVLEWRNGRWTEAPVGGVASTAATLAPDAHCVGLPVGDAQLRIPWLWSGSPATADSPARLLICREPASGQWLSRENPFPPELVTVQGEWWSLGCLLRSVDHGMTWNILAPADQLHVSLFSNMDPLGRLERLMSLESTKDGFFDQFLLRELAKNECHSTSTGQPWRLTKGAGIYVGEASGSYPRLEGYKVRDGIPGGRPARLDLLFSGMEAFSPEEVTVAVSGVSKLERAPGRRFESLSPVEYPAGEGKGAAWLDGTKGRFWRMYFDPTGSPLAADPGEQIHLRVLVRTNADGKEFQQSVDLPPFEYDPWHWARDLKKTVEANPFWLVPLVLGIGFILTLLLLLTLLFLRPLALPRLHRSVRNYRLVDALKDVPILGPILQVFLGVTLLPFFARRPRTLDAWVHEHGEELARKFGIEGRDLSEASYVPLPVRIKDAETSRLASHPAAEDFKQLFQRKRTVLSILGPGGAGKTSLALEMGRWATAGKLTSHPMAPVLIDEETDNVEGVLRRKLKSWLDEEVDRDFLKALLRRKRLLVVFDHLSEMSEATRNHVGEIHGGEEALPVNAMVVTARFPIPIEGADPVEVHPQPLNPENLLYFITHQLQERDAQDVFGDFDDQLDLAKNIAMVVRLGKEKVPILPIVVSLYIREAVAQLRSSGGGLDDLPKSVPEVYFQFLRRVNPSDDVPNRMSDGDMLRAAERLATLSLSKSFEPEQEFLASEARKTLAAAGWKDPKELDPAQRLVDNGILAARIRGADTFYSFVLDPLLEVLAAMAMARDCGQDEQQWAAVLSAVADAGQSAEGFRYALYFVHDAYAEDYGWPDLHDEEAAPTD